MLICISTTILNLSTFIQVSFLKFQILTERHTQDFPRQIIEFKNIKEPRNRETEQSNKCIKYNDNNPYRTRWIKPVNTGSNRDIMRNKYNKHHRLHFQIQCGICRLASVRNRGGILVFLRGTRSLCVLVLFS